MATTHTPTSQLIADHMRSAPTFPATPAPQHQSAWHQQGGISHRTLIHFPTALLRPALSSAAVPGSAAGVPLVCVGNKAFVAGQQDRRHREYFNIDTGKAEKVALDDAVFTIGRGACGRRKIRRNLQIPSA